MIAEPCTDWEHQTRHLSANLARLDRGGRAGTALCRVDGRGLPVLVYDDEALNRQLQEAFPGDQPQIAAADLPACQPCADEARRRKDRQ